MRPTFPNVLNSSCFEAYVIYNSKRGSLSSLLPRCMAIRVCDCQSRGLEYNSRVEKKLYIGFSYMKYLLPPAEYGNLVVNPHTPVPRKAR